MGHACNHTIVEYEWETPKNMDKRITRIQNNCYVTTTKQSTTEPFMGYNLRVIDLFVGEVRGHTIRILYI